MQELRPFYEKDTDFKRYVDRIVAQYGYTVDETLALAITKEVAKMYKSEAAALKNMRSTYNPVGECV